MKPVNYEEQFRAILRSHAWLTAALEAVRSCDPPDWLIGGGVLRNVVWDHLHGYSKPTPLADVDVAYFDAEDLSPDRERALESRLRELLPDVPWQVKNQAAVHLWYERKFGAAVEPLTSIEEAVATWPESATCVGVSLQADGSLKVVAPLGLDDLFGLILRRNPRRCTLELFQQRLRGKQIQQKWPRVRVIDG